MLLVAHCAVGMVVPHLITEGADCCVPYEMHLVKGCGSLIRLTAARLEMSLQLSLLEDLPPLAFRSKRAFAARPRLIGCDTCLVGAWPRDTEGGETCHRHVSLVLHWIGITQAEPEGRDLMRPRSQMKSRPHFTWSSG